MVMVKAKAVGNDSRAKISLFNQITTFSMPLFFGCRVSKIEKQRLAQWLFTFKVSLSATQLKVNHTTCPCFYIFALDASERAYTQSMNKKSPTPYGQENNESVNEPRTQYDLCHSSTLRFFSSLEAMNAADAQEMALIDGVKHLQNATETIKLLYADELKHEMADLTVQFEIFKP